MIIKNLKIYLQNVRKNSLIINTILETLTHFNIILIQEPPWSEICKIPSSSNREGNPLIGSVHHPNWILFARTPSVDKDSPRVISYINIHLSSFCFLLCKDIINYRDINLISFSNNNICYYILNVYSDSSHTALKYLKDTEVNINNIVLMTGEFNIRDSLWDPSFPFHSSISDDLIIIADSFDLALSLPTNPGPIRYLDVAGESNSVIDLMFLHNGSSELDHHTILPESRLSSDHTPLSVNIPITEEIIQTSKFTLAPNSEQETMFIQDIISHFKHLDMSNIVDTEVLERVVNWLGSIIDQAWTKNAKKSRISKHSKQWWSDDCKRSLDNYRLSRSLNNWKNSVKNAKQSFFNDKIQEVANKSWGPWELTNWIKRRKLPTIETINHDNRPYLTLDSLWNTLHSSFNTVLNCRVDLNILNKIECKPSQQWSSFSRTEFKSAISKCSDPFSTWPRQVIMARSKIHCQKWWLLHQHY